MCLVLFILMRYLSIGFYQHSSCRDGVHRFPCGTDGKRCKSSIFPKSILLVFYLLLILCPFSFPIESLGVCLLQNGLWSENIRTDVFGYGVDSAPLQSVQLSFCISEGTCNFCRFPAENYRCLVVHYYSFLPLSFSQNLAPVRFLFQVFSALLVSVCFNC